MKTYYYVLMDSPLLEGISENELGSLLSCLAAKKRSFSKNDIIFSAEQSVSSIGLVLCGEVQIVQDDFWGNRTILANIGPGATFAEAFCCAGIKSLSVSIIATKPCEVMFIDYSKIIVTCPASCNFHHLLISNMLGIIASKNVMLTRKIEHVTKRSTREKILSFLSFHAQQNQSSSFRIPFDRQGLADYLAVDRSALSGELAKLKKEGVLNYDKNAFELL